MSKSSRYDEYIPLFGRKDDKRVRLYLDVLVEHANIKKATAASYSNPLVTDVVKLDKVYSHMKNKFFATPVGGGVGVDDAHPEWHVFFGQMINRIAGKNQNTVTPAQKDEILKVIKSLAGQATPGSLKELMQEVVKAIMNSIGPGAAGVDKVNEISWSKATEFEFNDEAALYGVLVAAGSGIDANSGSKAIRGDILTDFVKQFGYDKTSPANVRTFIGSIAASPLNAGTIFQEFTAKMTAAAVDGMTATNCRKALSDVITSLDTATSFNYRFDKFFISTLLEEAASKVEPVSSTFFGEDVKSANNYFRNDKGELCILEKGNVVVVEVGSEHATKLLTETNKCMTTGVETSGSLTCADYLRTCLMGGDVGKCKDFMKDLAFWGKAVNEVDNMHPSMALETLKAFEFSRYSKDNETLGMELQVVESVDEWLESLKAETKKTPPQITESEYKAIKNNEKLIGYLKMIVKKINENPSILNKHYRGGPLQRSIAEVNKESFSGSYLSKLGVGPLAGAVQRLSSSDVERVSGLVRDNRARLSISLGYAGLTGMRIPLVMSGGADWAQLVEKQLDSNKRTAGMFRHMFIAYAQRLNAVRKEISTADTNKINELIDTLDAAETKLYKTMAYAEKYAQLLEIHQQQDAEKVLSFDHLKSFVDRRNKYFDRTAKRQNDLISILRTLAEAATKEAPQTVSAEVATGPIKTKLRA